jgi:hypothetical protein
MQYLVPLITIVSFAVLDIKGACSLSIRSCICTCWLTSIFFDLLIHLYFDKKKNIDLLIKTIYDFSLKFKKNKKIPLFQKNIKICFSSIISYNIGL